MAGQPLSPELAQQAVDALARAGSKAEAARILGIPFSTLDNRLQRAQQMLAEPARPDVPDHPARLQLDIENGQVLIASDAHYWPGIVTTMHRAFVRACREMKPRVVIMNGDVFDGASVSRHSPIMWETSPTVKQEVETCQARLGEIEQAAGKAQKIWTFGNHDARFESKLAMQAPQFAGVDGMHLKDNFPLWEPCWSAFINDNAVVKHRFKGGIHATHNNALWAGRSIVTGHLHSAKVTPLTDYAGTRWGVDSGTLCEYPWAQAMAYIEDNPVNWRSAFVVLTFHKGRLLQPELALQHAPGQVDWQGRVWDV